MKVKYVFMDIDGTMTRFLTGKEIQVSPKSLLEDLVMEKNGLSREEAWQQIMLCGDINIHCLSEFLPALGIDSEVYFQALLDSVAPNVEGCEDTKRFLPYLKENGYQLYTATTNSKFITNVKLSLCGLADINGCPYLTGYYPGCAFLDPKGKFAPDYYDRILADGGFAPEYCMMIGDEPLSDSIPAMKAGMHYGVNIDRKQKEKYCEKDGILFINSLDVLIPLLEKV